MKTYVFISFFIISFCVVVSGCTGFMRKNTNCFFDTTTHTRVCLTPSNIDDAGSNDSSSDTSSDGMN